MHEDLSSMQSTLLAQQGRESAGAVDVEVFQTITTDSHLKRPSVHQDRDQALLVLTMIRFLAYMLTMVFYHRQILSHRRKGSLGFCSMAKMIANLLTSEPPDTS